VQVRVSREALRPPSAPALERPAERARVGEPEHRGDLADRGVAGAEQLERAILADVLDDLAKRLVVPVQRAAQAPLADRQAPRDPRQRGGPVRSSPAIASRI
jgi:hypothetical protein